MPSEVRSGPTVASSDGHFLVHYASRGSHQVPASRARKLARLAEDAWRIEIGRWGWPRPLDDGDGRLDIYVYRLRAAGQVTPDAGGGPASAWMAVHPDYVNPVLVSHEFMHMSQAAIADYQGQVLTEGLGYWAGYAAARSANPPDWPQFDPIRPFGCVGYESCVVGKWAFFQFLAERYGHRLLIDAYRRAAEMTTDREGRAVPAIDAALRARGTSIGPAHVGYVGAVTAGAFRLGVLRQFQPVPALRAGLRCSAGTSKTLRVAGLGARWAELDSFCVERDASMRVSVTWPAELEARPSLAGHGEVVGLPVTRAAGEFTATIPTTALGSRLRLGLPNPSLDPTRVSFQVSVRSRAQRLARVRVLRRVQPARGRPRAVTVKTRSSRPVWLGVGFWREGLDAESVSLARAPRGTRVVRLPVPPGLRRGRYMVSVRGGLMDGPVSGTVRIPGRG